MRSSGARSDASCAASSSTEINAGFQRLAGYLNTPETEANFSIIELNWVTLLQRFSSGTNDIASTFRFRCFSRGGSGGCPVDVPVAPDTPIVR